MAEAVLICRRVCSQVSSSRLPFETIHHRRSASILSHHLSRPRRAPQAPPRLRSLATQKKPVKRDPARQTLGRNSQAQPSTIPPLPSSPAPTRPVSDGATAGEHATTQIIYPETLLIYHTGQAKTVFIASVKFAGVLVWIAGTFLWAPAFYFDPFANSWLAPVVSLIAAIPLGITVFFTPPFVTYVHLVLPYFTRTSSSRLHRFASNLPSTAQLDMTTMTWFWPRVTRMSASELYIARNQVGSMTLRREIPDAVRKARRWWMWRPLGKFLLAGKSTGKLPEKGVWEEVLSCVARGWERRSVGTPDARLQGTKRRS